MGLSVGFFRPEVEGKDQEWKIKLEEILTLTKEMSRGQMGKEEAKASKDDCDRMVREVSRPNEREKMLKDYAEAATEELSSKKIEFSDVREKNEMLETRKMLRRSKRRKTRKTYVFQGTLCVHFRKKLNNQKQDQKNTAHGFEKIQNSEGMQENKWATRTPRTKT